MLFELCPNTFANEVRKGTAHVRPHGGIGISASGKTHANRSATAPCGAHPPKPSPGASRTAISNPRHQVAATPWAVFSSHTRMGRGLHSSWPASSFKDVVGVLLAFPISLGSGFAVSASIAVKVGTKYDEDSVVPAKKSSVTRTR